MKTVKQHQLLAGYLWFFLPILCGATLNARPPEDRNPHTSPADLAVGAGIFRAQCAICHAPDGTGEAGPDLTRGRFRHGEGDDSTLFRIISSGIPGTEMRMTLLSERQVWQVLGFIRTLSQPSTKTPLRGDPAEGKRLFQGKGHCSRCHIVNGQGGRLGPDLSKVSWKRSPRYLRNFIAKPNVKQASTSQVFVQGSRRYWPVTITHEDGKTIDGVLLNEDTYSIQLMDEKENLHSYWKEDLKEIQLGKSPAMPSYQGILSKGELDDLVVYLYSLRGE